MTEVKAEGGLGFRELHEFNLALLAKQLWRILMNPNLLVSRVLKARYFRGTSIWRTGSYGTDSYCWKSLLQARGILEEGIRKQVGDGKFINIWEDRWIPGSGDGKVKTRRAGDVELQEVSELIKEGVWDKELITKVFDKDEGKQILSIPLGEVPRKDRLFWAFSTTGVYTVKSGYRLAKKEKRMGGEEWKEAGTSFGRSGVNQHWNFLWGQSVKHKLKHFIWKCLHGILPVNAVIRERCLKGDYVCKGCGEGPETTEHMLFFCSNAKLIWKVAPLNWEGLEVYRHKFWLWWEGLKEAVSKEKGMERICLTINLLWQIWKSSNDKQVNGCGRDPLVAVNKAVVEWQEYQEAQETEGEVRDCGTKANKDVHGWERPQEGWIKLNSDAALQSKGDRAGWGMVARDWQGLMLGAWAVPSSSASNPKQEESMALKLAMKLAKQQVWKKVVFEVDCLQVVEELNREGTERIESVVFEDIRSTREFFDECCFTFTRRVNNFVSHTLAKLAISLEFSAEWKEVFPAWLHDLVQMECKGSCPDFCNLVSILQ